MKLIIGKIFLFDVTLFYLWVWLRPLSDMTGFLGVASISSISGTSSGLLSSALLIEFKVSDQPRSDTWSTRKRDSASEVSRSWNVKL